MNSFVAHWPLPLLESARGNIYSVSRTTERAFRARKYLYTCTAWRGTCNSIFSEPVRVSREGEREREKKRKKGPGRQIAAWRFQQPPFDETPAGGPRSCNPVSRVALLSRVNAFREEVGGGGGGSSGSLSTGDKGNVGQKSREARFSHLMTRCDALLLTAS